MQLQILFCLDRCPRDRGAGAAGGRDTRRRPRQFFRRALITSRPGGLINHVPEEQKAAKGGPPVDSRHAPATRRPPPAPVVRPGATGISIFSIYREIRSRERNENVDQISRYVEMLRAAAAPRPPGPGARGAPAPERRAFAILSRAQSCRWRIRL
ncbi:hypothetical protein EVAR_8980_1 [Eumeta japonica]|uniref:Uncharacterized protein n=1 Tax=Eumeta variegata TaxID=151549 RepID=A0A4C1WQD0_EUMVA|nr:hypothetical protein EVAR_8980_1 [Eumeta japonica]